MAGFFLLEENVDETEGKEKSEMKVSEDDCDDVRSVDDGQSKGNDMIREDDREVLAPSFLVPFLK